LQRFHNEARAAATLHHTNIVPVFAVGCERGVHYYAMQFIDGRTLADIIAERRGPVPGRPTMKGEAGPGGAEFELASPVAPPPAGDATGPYTPSPVAGAASSPTPPAAGLSTAPPAAEPGYFRAVAQWGAQAAEALDHAHQLGIVHRDV